MLLVMESDNLACFPSEQEQLCSLVEEGLRRLRQHQVEVEARRDEQFAKVFERFDRLTGGVEYLNICVAPPKGVVPYRLDRR